MTWNYLKGHEMHSPDWEPRLPEQHVECKQWVVVLQSAHSKRNSEFAAWGAMLLMLLLVGCNSAAAPPNARQHASKGHSHENHASHEEEHGILPHKPRTLADAVTQIDQRGHALLSHHHGHDINEWFDILGWLPEIAADTDLKKSEWDSVTRIGRELEMWSTGWKSGNDNRPDPAKLDSLVAELKAIVAQLPERG